MPDTFLLKWDEDGKRFYETGVSRGVLYTGRDRKGVVWNGLTAVNEAPEGGEPNALYADDIKYLNLLSNEDYKATIEAYTYPDEFMECDGSAELAIGVYAGQQKRKPFGFSYVTKIGNDEDFSDHGYKIHLVYNALAAPSDKNYETINDTPDAITFSWEVSTTPVAISPINGVNYKPTAHLVIDSTKFTSTEQKAKLLAFEELLYGKSEGSVEAYLPLPDEVISMLSDTAVLQSIAVTTAPTDTTYSVGEYFDPTGMVVKATYSDGGEAVVLNAGSYTYSPNRALVAADTAITVSYTEGGITKTATTPIYVS